jgi:hypothetical protein
MTIREFLLEVARDPRLQERIRAGDETLFTEFELSERQQQLLRSGEIQSIRVHIRAEVDLEGEDFYIETVWGMSTVWNPPPPPPPTES